jgi:TetR/AcrR family transcriptional repressor of nem operon
MTRRGEHTRERILLRATDLVARRGFRATSVNDLVEATGVNRGSLYFHFPDKNALGVAMLERAGEQFQASIKESLTGTSPGRRLENFFQAALRAHESTGFVGGCLWGNTALEVSDAEGHERFVEIVRDVFAAWMGMIEGVITEAQQSGQVRGDMQAAALASQTVAVIEGGIMLSRLNKDAGPLRNCLNGLRQMLQLRTDDERQQEIERCK